MTKRFVFPFILVNKKFACKKKKKKVHLKNFDEFLKDFSFLRVNKSTKILIKIFEEVGSFSESININID